VDERSIWRSAKGGKDSLREEKSSVSHRGRAARKPSKVEGVGSLSVGKMPGEGRTFQWGTTVSSKVTGMLSAGRRRQIQEGEGE
jgi:hypothetical protein